MIIVALAAYWLAVNMNDDAPPGLTEQERKFLDHLRAGFPDEWTKEPDQDEWTAATGYHCAIRRTMVQTLCGYVAVPWGHPAWGWDRDDERLDDVYVHGGITWSGAFPSAEPQGPWWFGFDCAHYQDFIPGVAAALAKVDHPYPMPDAVYRNFAYVRLQCESLAKQLHAMLDP